MFLVSLVQLFEFQFHCDTDSSEKRKLCITDRDAGERNESLVIGGGSRFRSIDRLDRRD